MLVTGKSVNSTFSKPPAKTPGWENGRIILQDGQQTLLFQDPVGVVAASDPSEVENTLQYIADNVDRRGYYAAGFLTYEAAAAFDLATHQQADASFPLLWFGFYERPRELDLAKTSAGEYKVGRWEAALDRADYNAAIAAIKSLIADGHTYQVNYTMPLHASFSGDPWALYCDLARSQQAEYMAYLDLGRFVICSASPELFFYREGDQLLSRPMKGTAPRGRTLSEDRAQMEWLHSSVKNRAENVMIVDMIRNDFGRIAKTGSVKVPQLFTVERYPTLLQMTSTVSARSHASLPEIVRAMFPCASITGAPKVRTMEIIRELEPQPRGIYTGSIGFIAPQQRASFNVAIRTVVIDCASKKATYGVGGGIVWDSEADQEYNECLLKAQVLVRRQPPFDLLETMRWTPEDGYFLLDLHLERLAESAEYFGFACDLQAIEPQLRLATKNFSGATRVRLLVGRQGEATVQSSPLPETTNSSPLRIGLASKPVMSTSIWLYHKTTNRQIYEEVRAAYPEVDEVILWNEIGELTEATMSNIVLDLDGQLVTPPVMSGLLAGTFRRHLLQNGRLQEQKLTKDDLKRCRKVYLVNSVRLWQNAEVIDPS